jgi:hypothetical protein
VRGDEVRQRAERAQVVLTDVLDVDLDVEVLLQFEQQRQATGCSRR